MRSRPLACCMMMTLSLAAAAGCGTDLARVSGTVTLDGEPIAGGSGVRGTVTFSPEDGLGTTAVGILDANGRYELSTGTEAGVVPGSYAVAISVTRIIIPTEPGGTPSGRPITPRHYASTRDSGLRAVVEPGRNTIDFALESRH